MGTILERIIAQKKIEVQELTEREALTAERKHHPSLVEKLRTNKMTIISEIKRASPSKGDFNLGVDIEKQARSYETLGAGAISVLTDAPFFKGSFADLQKARGVVDVPLLCKDFVIDEAQIRKANMMGADIILLIVAALSPARLQELYLYAGQLGLEVIVEVHDEQELETALSIQPEIIGVNNRNLKTFEVDLGTTERLAGKINEAGVLLISESGIKTREDVIRVQQAGAKGILVGEAFMTADSLQELFQALQV
ncbi:MAG: indole-3-glycerol phosphate synthase TrpC [Ectobacillus sp.]